MPKRKTISKSLRFEIFARDGFTCRYCGRQSDIVKLEVDHVVPVCEGGGNAKQNLVTSCEDCNRGKGGRPILQSYPTETDRLRAAQENNEQRNVAEGIALAQKAREESYQALVNYWCEATWRDSVHPGTIDCIFSYLHEHGSALILAWIDKASRHPGRRSSDQEMGKYISGIRRKYKSGEIP